MFNIDKVSSVYSGRKGCACGCRGKYSYASKHADKRPSYYTGNDGISDRSVKIIANKVDRIIRDPNSQISWVHFDDCWIAVDMKHDQSYTIYFK